MWLQLHHPTYLHVLPNTKPHPQLAPPRKGQMGFHDFEHFYMNRYAPIHVILMLLCLHMIASPKLESYSYSK